LITPFYEDISCTIYCGDMAEILPKLGQFDLLLTDPPYGVGAFNSSPKTMSSEQNLSRSKFATDFGSYVWDVRCPELVSMAITKAKYSIVFGGNYYTDILPPSASWIIWDKMNGETSFADCELAWTNHKRAARKFTWKWAGFLQQWGGERKEKRVHAAQKPLRLMEWCIETYGGETILDPFMGSGTTLRAAKNLGRTCVGIELNEEYCQFAIERLSQEVFDFG